MNASLREFAKSCGRPVKRALEAAIDDRLVNYTMPRNLAGDILITFDDGPHPEYTPRILDLLEQFGARAMFFVIGERAQKHPELLRACHDRGHLVANHTYTHLNDVSGGRYSRNRVIEDITRCNDFVSEITGQRTRYFRPPRGELNRKTLGAGGQTQHRLMLWSIEGGEWGKRSDWSAEDISTYLVAHVKKRDILLLHDDNIKSLVVVSDLLKSLKARNFDMNSGVAGLI